MADHIAREITYTDENGVVQTTIMYEAQIGVRGGARGRKWFTCAQCRYDFSEDDIIISNGIPYCIPNHCADEHSGES